MDTKWLTIRQLDKRLKGFQALSSKSPRPKLGWIKTLRNALSMSGQQLADRLGVMRSRVNQLENAEIHDAITLRTLKAAADALGCELVYAIVPKNNSSLEHLIERQAQQIAKERVKNVAHSMSLEAQSVDAASLKKQQEEITKYLVEHLNKKLWAQENLSKSTKKKKRK